MSDEPAKDPIKKCAIIGTAPSWRAAPWNDPSVEFWCLNDSHLLRFPRADRWYDLHPFDKFYFRDDPSKGVPAEDVPAGTFVRPRGHIEWLASQRIPVYLQKADVRVPKGIVFPREKIEASFGNWFDSTPAWMLAHALMEGYREIHIYGIHLATEWEYLKQKPNMAFLCGMAVGMGVRLVLPDTSPLLRPSHRYAFEPDPSVPVTQAQRNFAKLKREREAVAAQLGKTKRWYRPRGDAALSSRVSYLDARLMDENLAAEYAMAHKRALVGG